MTAPLRDDGRGGRSAPPHVHAPAGRALSGRALLIGSLLAATVCYFAAAGLFVFHSIEVTRTSMPFGVIFPFTLIIVLNIVLKTLNPRWALRPGELIVIFAMGMTGNSFPIFLGGIWLAIISTPTYLTTPENNWGELLHPFRPDWITPSNAEGYITWFYEGLPRWYKGGIPWETWLVPLFWWIVFLTVFYFVCFSMMVILRRQWSDHERLAYPLLEVPREMIRGSDAPGVLPLFARSKLFWVGFGVSAFIMILHIISFFYPAFPYPNLGIIPPWKYVIPAREFPPINLTFLPTVIGFSYFANTDFTFSVWVFVLIHILEQGLFNRLGYTIGAEDVFNQGSTTIGMQNFGAFLMMIVISLWMSRRHLWAVARQAMGKRTMDDSTEPMSYRAAFWGGIGGVLFMAGWLLAAGMEFKAMIVFLVAALLIYLAIARIIAQVGLYYFAQPMNAQTLAIHLWGPANLQPSTMIAMGYQFTWHGDVQATFIQGAVQSIKLAEFARSTARALLWAMLAATVVGFATTIGTYLYYGYTMGAYNFGGWVFGTTAGTIAFEHVIGWMKAGTGPDLERLGFFAAGAAVQTALTFLRYHFPWWPLHPVGFACGYLWPVERHVVGIFLAWLCKSIVLRVGGAPLYEKSKPFFLGLALGHFTFMGIAFIIDTIFFTGEGHNIIG